MRLFSHIRRTSLLQSLQALGILLALVVTGCQREATRAAGPPPAVPVTVAKVAQKDLPLAIRSIGNVQSYQSVSIKSMVNAQIMAVHFKQGDDVTEGQLLYDLDPRQPEADLK